VALPLDLAPAQPLWQRVHALIADQIASGTLAPGQRLPAERALCDALGVSRATVRRALADLVADGLVESSAGRGSFVASGPLAEPANALMSLTELGASRGLAATARVLSESVREATLEEAELFAIAPGAGVFELARLRMLDGLPVAVDRARVPLRRAPSLVAADWSTASLYEELAAAGAAPVSAAYTLEAQPAARDEAALLGLDDGAPVLVTSTATHDAEGRLVEVTRTAYRGDRYRFHATLVRRRNQARRES